ncbi:MAG: AAA family ATPase [Terriglobales bacterium]
MDVAELIKTNCQMPNSKYSKLWDSIIVERSIKDRLLHSAVLSLRLRAELPFETTALHGLAFLYGPPGTGKTTLARGLAYHLAPLTARRKARFIEINPHGLMSAEHGQSQRRVTELLTEHIPAIVDDGMPTVVLLDEVESMVVARSQASLAANPADVHRSTDAVLTAVDSNASSLPHLLFVATSNFTGAIDEAFLSRADVAIHVPAPDVAGVLAILRATLEAMGTAFPRLDQLARSSELERVAKLLAGTDGRRVRKTVSEAMLGRLETVVQPGDLTIRDLMSAAALVRETQSITQAKCGGGNGKK